MRFVAAQVTIFMLLLQEVLGKVIFHSIPGNATLASATAYENLNWNMFVTDESSFKNMLPLIPLWEASEGYDPCSDTGYDTSMMHATVEAWYATYGPRGTQIGGTNSTKPPGRTPIA